MGGKAQKQTRRLSTAEWAAVINELGEKFAQTGAFAKLVAPRPEPEKMDHGDIDLFALVNPSIEHNKLHEIIRDVGLYNRREMTSYLYQSDAAGECQVDLNLVTDPSDMPLAQFLADFGDAGMIIGCYAKALGFRLSKSSGLTALKNIDESDCFKYQITKDPAIICKYLNLDFEAWQKGFVTKLSLFRWLRPSFPYVQQLPADRPLMALFLKQEWAGDLLRSHLYRKSPYERMAELGHLEGFHAALAEYIAQQDYKNKYKAVVNGWNIQEYVQGKYKQRLEGKELGLFIKRVKGDLVNDTVPTMEQLYSSIERCRR